MLGVSLIKRSLKVIVIRSSKDQLEAKSRYSIYNMVEGKNLRLPDEDDHSWPGGSSFSYLNNHRDGEGYMD